MAEPPPERTALRMVNIEKYFGSVCALKNINFEVGHNEIVGLIGDNGAGKSTLVKILTGVFPPTSGELYIADAQGGHGFLHREEGARAGNRDRLPGQVSRGEAGHVEELLHRPGDHLPARLPEGQGREADRQRDHGQHHRVPRQGNRRGFEGEQALRRRAPGRGHRQGNAFRGGSHHPGRADGRPLPEGSAEGAELRPQDQGGGQGEHLHLAQPRRRLRDLRPVHRHRQGGDRGEHRRRRRYP